MRTCLGGTYAPGLLLFWSSFRCRAGLVLWSSFRCRAGLVGVLWFSFRCRAGLEAGLATGLPHGDCLRDFPLSRLSFASFSATTSSCLSSSTDICPLFKLILHFTSYRTHNFHYINIPKIATAQSSEHILLLMKVARKDSLSTYLNCEWQ